MKDIEHARDEELLKARKAHLTFERTAKRHKEKDDLGEDDGVNVSDENALDNEFTDQELNATEIQVVSKTPDDYSRKIVQIRQRIEEEEKSRNMRLGNEHQVRLKYVKARTEVHKEADEIDEMGKKLEWFENDIKDRRATWKAFRKNLVKKTSLAFGNMLGFTDYSGSLHFDHEGKTLQLQVSKNNAAKSESNDVKALR